MAAGAIFGLPLSGRASVSCHAGELWVTGLGTDDRILRSGECIGISGPGRIVIQALAESRFGIRPGDCSHRAGRSGAR